MPKTPSSSILEGQGPYFRALAVPPITVLRLATETSISMAGAMTQVTVGSLRKAVGKELFGGVWQCLEGLIKDSHGMDLSGFLD